MIQQRDAPAATGLTFPIRLRCVSVADLCTQPGLEPALTRALGRAFNRARAELPAAMAIGAGVCLEPPSFAKRNRPEAADLNVLLALIGRSIKAAALAEAVPLRSGKSTGISRDAPAVARTVMRSDERFDPVRFDQQSGGYDLPSYDGGRASVSVKSRGHGRTWHVAATISLHIGVGRFLDWLDAFDPGKENVANLRLLYMDLLDTVRAATVWLVVADQPTLPTFLADEVRRQVNHSVERYVYGFSIFEADRQALERQTTGHELKHLPALRMGNPRTTSQVLGKGALLLFVSMPVPKVELQTTALLADPLSFIMPLKEAAFLIEKTSFEKLFGIPWSNYLREFGDRPATLQVRLLDPIRRIAYETLRYLIRDSVESQIGSDTAWWSDLVLLNNPGLAALPPAVRAKLRPLVDDTTLALDAERRFGQWEPAWTGAFLYVTLPRDREDIGTATNRPIAIGLLPDMLKWVESESTDYQWSRSFYHFLAEKFGKRPPDKRPEGGTPFEFILAELEHRGLFDTLFAKLDCAQEGVGVRALALRLTFATRYADNPRVKLSEQLLGRLVLSQHENRYQLDPATIFLGGYNGPRIGLKEPFLDKDGSFVFERTEQMLTHDARQKLRAAVDLARQELIRNIIRGDDTNEYTEDEFARATLSLALGKVPLSDDDFEKVTIQRSLWITGITAATVDALPRFYVTFEIIERAGGATWRAISKPVTEIEDEFEARLIYWRLGKAGEFWRVAGIVVLAAGLVVIALEAGLVAALIQGVRAAGSAALAAAGGTKVVLISIAISEVIMVIRHIYYGEPITLRDILMGAVDGYLGALGFRGAGFLGNWAARAIGFQSLRALVGGWVAEKLVIGAIGGAGTAALTRFSHDIVGVAVDGKGWSRIGEYVEDMAWGALFGIVFEAVGAPIFKSAVGTTIESYTSLRDIVRAIRADGIGSLRLNAAIAEGLGNIRARLSVAIGDIHANGFADAMSRRLAGVGEELWSSVKTTSAKFVSERVLELGKVSLSDSARAGLDKLVNASELKAGRSTILFDLLSKHLESTNAFLEVANNLEPAAIRKLIDGTFAGSAADTAAFLAGLRRYSAEQQHAILDLLGELGEKPATTGPAGQRPAPRTTPGDKPPAAAATHVNQYPEGLVHYDLTRPEAYDSYQESIRADPSREAAIYMDPTNGKHLVVQGSHMFVDGAWALEPGMQRPWQLIEHFHPEGARFASIDDFFAMMDPQLRPGAPEQAVSTRIRWVDPASKIQFLTEIGYTPGANRPYWIRYFTASGEWRFFDFADTPWNAGSDYIRFLRQEGVPQPVIPARQTGRGNAGGGPSAPPGGKQSQRVLDPQERVRAAAEQEAVNKQIASEQSALRASQTELGALQARLRSLRATTVPRPRELEGELRNALGIEDIEEKVAALQRLRQRPGLSPQATKYLDWQRDIWATLGEIEDIAAGRVAVGRLLERLHTVDVPEAAAAVRAASKAVKDFLRTVGPNYRDMSRVNYDQILGEARWRDLPARLALATDHLVALDRIATMPELTDFPALYEAAPDPVRANMTDDLVALGDRRDNLIRMRADANGMKNNKSWHDITYDQAAKYGYSVHDVDALRIREDKSLQEIRQAIRGATERYQRILKPPGTK